jgi:hypothetical protein
LHTSAHLALQNDKKKSRAARTVVFASAHLAPHETQKIACRANWGFHFPVNRGSRLVASPLKRRATITPAAGRTGVCIRRISTAKR